MRALEDPWVHILLSFVCTLCHHLLCCFFCCSFLLGLITNIFESSTLPCARCYIFFSQKEYPPTWQSIPSHTHTKNSVTKNPSWNSCCTHDIPSQLLSPSFGLYFSSFFLFFFGSVIFFFPSRFFNYEKKKILLNLSPLFSFRGGVYILPPSTDTKAPYALNLLSVTTRLSAHSYYFIDPRPTKAQNRCHF